MSRNKSTCHGEIREEIFRFVESNKTMTKASEQKGQSSRKKMQVEKSKHLLLGYACFKFIFVAALRRNSDSQSQSYTSEGHQTTPGAFFLLSSNQTDKLQKIQPTSHTNRQLCQEIIWLTEVRHGYYSSSCVSKNFRSYNE